MTARFLAALICALTILPLSTAQTCIGFQIFGDFDPIDPIPLCIRYYVDPVNGNDSNSGTATL